MFSVCVLSPVCAYDCLCYVCLVVAEMIQITVQPQSQQAMAGSRVVLTCRAVGPPGLSYQWFRGKEEVSPIIFQVKSCLVCCRLI